ncbi:MAG: alginate export family protein [Candidatus Omnitrophica bacterium]|nr:alginate export family protein [Candidatus Omnitrophota bacterium]
MMKATLRGAVLLGLLLLSVPSLSFADTQNLKVGGDTTVRGFWRKNMDLNRDNDAAGGRKDNFMMQTTGVNIDADLTENVRGRVRLVNERDWDSTTASDQAHEVDVSQAFIELNEFLYSPLKISLGTMPVKWGRGFVLGSNLLPGTLARQGDLNDNITANEFTDFTSFDGIRGQLDLSAVAGPSIPLLVDIVYLKLDENLIVNDDDTNLLGVNLGTRFDEWNSEVEAYYLNKRATDRRAASLTPDSDNKGSINTWGLRGSAKPSDASNVWGELAYQHGRRISDPAGVRIQGEHVSAWAANFGGQYTMADVAMKPGLGLEWIFWSGKNKSGDPEQPGAAPGWDPIARSYFTTAIREFQTEDSITGFFAVDQEGVTSAATNQHQFAVFTDLDPVEDLHVNSRLTWFVADVGLLTRADNTSPAGTGGTKRKSFIGTEWDTVLTYNYTDDVQLGAIFALFQPGTVFRVPNDDTAQELITWAKLTF